MAENQLNERIRGHNYRENRVVADFLPEQRRRSLVGDDEQIIIRERHLSDVSIVSYNSDHERCMTPVPDDQMPHDLMCLICLSVVINPFRCTTVGDNQSANTEVCHLCCCQCVLRNMQYLQTNRFSCPVCRVNEFNLDNMTHADELITKSCQKFIIHCPNYCGLMGSPLALSHHICIFQPNEMPGHTKQTNLIHDLIGAITNLNSEISDLKIQFSEMIRNREQYWRSKSVNLQQNIDMSVVRSQHVSQVNTDLRQHIEELEHNIRRLQIKHAMTVSGCRKQLKKLAKFYETKIEEIDECRDRLKQEINDLIALSDPTHVTESLTAQINPTDGLTPTEVMTSCDEHLFGNMFQNSDFPPLPTAAAPNAPQLPRDSSDEEFNSNKFY